MEEYFIEKFPCWLIITKYSIDIYETKEKAHSAFVGFCEAGEDGRIVKLNSENKCE
jgi:hypothetical protein